MPIEKCTSNGISGQKFGSKGKCYTGKDARKKARKQGAAISISKTRRKK